MKFAKCLLPVGFVLLLVTASATWSQEDDKKFVKVVSGDTLFVLVRTHYPALPSRWSMIENEIFKMNPHAFSNAKKSSLRVGVLLEMPFYDAPKKQIPSPPPEPEPQRHSLATVGAVKELSGTPKAIDINNEQRLLELGGDVFRGDAILTEGDSAAHLQMNDGAELYIRARSRIVIQDYSFIEAAPTSSRSIITLLKGGFRAITGLIGRHNPASVRINTAVATIGVRGTDFAIRICEPDECSLPDIGAFEPGDYSGVLGGEITISNATGITPVAAGQVMRTTSPDSAPEPAPEAAALIFTDAELALLKPPTEEPMGFFRWLRTRIFGKPAD
ncbi:MAG: FecR family protein [Gammaproteobacteria bacterium]|nr:FecR family protein [Gammaproteobacteria bacterium]MDH3768632.1 FecR family protein [Gammaproteobacteria bacterium]